MLESDWTSVSFFFLLVSLPCSCGNWVLWVDFFLIGCSIGVLNHIRLKFRQLALIGGGDLI